MTFIVLLERDGFERRACWGDAHGFYQYRNQKHYSSDFIHLAGLIKF